MDGALGQPRGIGQSRRDQWVLPLGLVCSAVLISLAILSSLVLRGRPGLISLCRPAMPRSLKRLRHSDTVGRLPPKRRATALLASPSAIRNTIFARRANAARPAIAPIQAELVRFAHDLSLAGLPSFIAERPPSKE